MWSKNFDKCIECKTTEDPYHGYGLCRNCYMKKIRSDNPDIHKEMSKRYKQTPEYRAQAKKNASRPEAKALQRERSRLYKERHPERMKEIQKRWEEKHPDTHKNYRNRPEVKLNQRKKTLMRKYGIVAFEVLERDNNRCRKCGNGDESQLHHIDWDKNNNTLENLIVLCNSCHKTLHSWSPPNLRRMIFEEWMKLPLKEPVVDIE